MRDFGTFQEWALTSFFLDVARYFRQYRF